MMRAPNTTPDQRLTNEKSGEGTGRDIVRRIVVAHGGEVTFDSRPGETRFVVRLPIKGRNVEEGEFG